MLGGASQCDTFDYKPELQRRGRSGVPLYLLFTPGSPEPRVLPQLLTEGVVVEALNGVRSNP